MRRIRRGITTCTAIAALAAGLAACGDDDVDGKDKTSEADSVTDALHESVTLATELQTAVNRLVVDCMEDQDFNVHPLWLTQPVTPEHSLSASVLGDKPPEFYEIPTLKDAKKEGFGSNVLSDPDGAGFESEPEEDDPYYEESEKYQDEYRKAQYGDEYVEWMAGKESDDNEGLPPAPLEGGCTGEVSKVVYGEPVQPDPDTEDENASPYYGIAMPEVGDGSRQRELYETAEMLDARDGLSKCIEDEGYPYFEYNQDYGFDLIVYVDRFYKMYSGKLADNDDVTDYQLPKGAPWEFDEAFEAELAFATVVAQCADDTGFRKTMNDSWDAALGQVAVDSEEEIFAWHDNLQSTLEKAQDLIGK